MAKTQKNVQESSLFRVRLKRHGGTKKNWNQRRFPRGSAHLV